ncbi:hypothetical protein ACTA71_011145 [Dictyostelium dimigraforme]
MENEIFFSLSKIIYSGLLITSPFWIWKSVGKLVKLKDTISQTICISCILSSPVALSYTLFKQFLRNDKTFGTILIPIIPIFTFFSTRFIHNRLHNGSNRQR